MRRFPSVRPRRGYLIKTASTALLTAVVASCSSDDWLSLSAIQSVVKERVASALGAELEEMGEKGSATVNVNGGNVTVSVSGGSSPMTPPKLPGGEVVFRAEGANDVTFQMTARENVAGVEKFYRSSFASDGLVEKDIVSADGLFRGEWVDSDGKPRAFVYAYGDNAGPSHVAVALIKP